jgi:hypothetical protein
VVILFRPSVWQLSDRVALDVMMQQRKAKMQAAACTSQVCVWVRGRWRKWSRGAEKWGCDGNGTTPDPSNEGRPAATAPRNYQTRRLPILSQRIIAWLQYAK